MSASLIVVGNEIALQTVYDVTVETGRDDTESQPDASVLNADILGYDAAGNVGDEITLTSSIGVIFHGWITDITANLDTDDDGNLVWRSSVVATGPLALLGQIEVGDNGYPEQRDSERIWQIVTDAGIGHRINPDMIGPAILAHAAERSDAAGLARAAADSGTGVLWEQPADPSLPLRYSPQRLRRWARAEHTWDELADETTWGMFGPWMWSEVNSDNLGGLEGAPPLIVLDPQYVLAELRFDQTIADLARTVTVAYGVAAEGGNRPSQAVGNLPPQISVDTELVNAGDAAAKADTMYRQHRDPAWRISGIQLDLMWLTPARRALIANDLQVGTKLEIPFPHGSPVGPLWQGFLEGWKHHLVADSAGNSSHWLELKASERSLTEPCLRWIDVGSYLWLEVNAYETWESACDLITGIVALRWNSATGDWDSVPIEETWQSSLEWETV